MLDIQFIRENRELVQEKARLKSIDVDINVLLDKDETRRALLKEVEDLRQKRNELAQKNKGQKPSEDDIQKGKKLREKIDKLEAKLEEVNSEYKEIIGNVPNVFPDDTPIGGEEANKPVKVRGKAEKKKVADHLSWAEGKDYLDFERGAKVAGNKFYYAKGALVELELACMQLAVNTAIKHGFTPMSVPHLVNETTIDGTGFSPRGDEDQIYKIEGENLNLIATSEIPITGYHSGEIFDKQRLPLLYVGISPAYRKEAGAYGKHSKGLYRVHQFNKVELYIFCEPEDSAKWHEKLVAIEEELCKSLEIPYRVVRIASGDLGAPAYKKFDIEYWSPLENKYRELTSCSNVTDYQARRLNIRYRRGDEGTDFVHTLNGTAMAFSRTAIALIENHQDRGGDLKVPKALRKYMGGKKTI
ncbi:MAG TPA: serine--tRNA ligase [Candidatus Saccharimonadales bacterium]|nr:serine--tRNA ligase [Candidatus Saccharimonadales bacterium]